MAGFITLHKACHLWSIDILNTSITIDKNIPITFLTATLTRIGAALVV